MNKFKNLVFIVSLVLANWTWGQDLSNASLEELAKLYSNTDLDDDDLVKLCESRNLSACGLLASTFKEYGEEGITPDSVAAKNAFEKLCNQGNMSNCANLGLMYHKGYGVKKNSNKAKQLYEKSCNANAGDGCEGLAGLYENGEGVKKNLSAAIKLYDKACSLDDIWGCARLSSLYFAGEKVKKDMNKHYKYRKKECDLGGLQDICSAEEKKFLEKYK